MKLETGLKKESFVN